VVKVTQAHVEARREAIRDAAFRLFVRKGVEGARMEEIAAEAGLSAGAIYRYFPSKEHLLQAVLSFCIDHNLSLFDVRGLESASPLNVLSTKARQVWSELGTPSGRDLTILRLESALAAARHGGPVAAERHEMLTAIVSFTETLLWEAQQAGEIVSTVDAHALATTLVAAWVGLDMMSLDLGEQIDRDGTFEVIAGVLRCLAPPADSTEGETPNGIPT
jgi:AcrR family transcriptional regulator